MYCNAEDNSIFQADIAKEECAKRNLTVVDKSVTDSNQIQQVTESLIGKVDAIYIPTDNLLAEGMATCLLYTSYSSMIQTGIPITVSKFPSTLATNALPSP